MAEQNDRIALLQGTLDMLILRTLLFGPAHGHGIGKHIQRSSEDVLQVDHGSLYPALHRLEVGVDRARTGDEVLPAHARRQETAGGAGVEVEADGNGNCPGHAAGQQLAAARSPQESPWPEVGTASPTGGRD
jgi:hypothetical protein